LTAERHNQWKHKQKITFYYSVLDFGEAMPKRKTKDPDRSPDLPHNWIERHLERLEKFLYFDPIDLTPWAYRRAQYLGPVEYREIDSTWGEIHLGELWGGPDVTGFFQKIVTIPESHAGPDTVLDIFMDGGETQLSIDGQPWQGLDWHRSIIPLGDFAEAGREIELSMEAFIINYPYDDRRHDARELHCFERARLLKVDREVESFLADARLLLDAYLSYWKSDSNLEIEGFLRHHLEAACRHLGPHIANQQHASAAAAQARKLLQENVFASEVYRSAGQINIHAHSHLDIIYLWPIKETYRKNCRTITNQLSLMREFPAYRFSYSQPFLYESL
jgi:alpha-mannosidase